LTLFINGAVHVTLAVVIVIVVKATLIIRWRHLCWSWVVCPGVIAQRSTRVLLPQPPAATTTHNGRPPLAERMPKV